ncbi:MAG: CHAT domain-containing protein [bacterium]|nr:CHAT domain-containing protein [bacterium]
MVELDCTDEAIAHFQSAIDIWRTCGEAVPPYFLVSAMTDLGEVYLTEDTPDEAEAILTEALEVARVQGLAEWQDAYARLLSALSRTYHRLGRLERATEYGWAALELASTIHAPSDGRVADFQQELAELLFVQDQKEAALALQTTALDLCERAYGPYHPATAEGFERLAFMQSRYTGQADSFLKTWRSHKPQALRSVEVAYRSRFDWLRAAADALPEYELVQSADDFRRTAGQYLDILIQSGDSLFSDRAASIVYDGKALLWDALGERYAHSHEFQNSAGDTLQKLRRDIQNCIVLATREPSDSLRQRLEYLWNKRVHWEREYDDEERKKSPLLAYTPTTVLSVRDALPDSTIALDFVRYLKPVTWDERLPCYALLCNTRNTAKLVDLGPCARIDSLVHDLVLQCNTPSDLDEGTYGATAGQLFELLLGAVSLEVESASQVFVSTDGPLHSLSFGTLVDRHGRYLVERSTFGYLHSGRDLVRQQRAAFLAESGHGWLVVADPDFDAEGAPASFAVPTSNILVRRSTLAPAFTNKWNRLPATIDEAKAALVLADSEQAEVITGERPAGLQF